MEELEILEGLPTSLLEVAEVIGLVNALALATLYGGHQLYIPRRFQDDHLVTQVLGRETADRLSATFCGVAIDLAKADALQREQRDLAICQHRDQRVKVADLARHYRLTERRIYGILRRKRRTAPGQLNLFG